MSLRPRYSLLTLLLLTAAIAVGVKLWRGPHDLVLTHWPCYIAQTKPPPSAEERRLLQLMPLQSSACSSCRIDYSLQYTQEPQRK
jgi:hypothetical protein